MTILIGIIVLFNLVLAITRLLGLWKGFLPDQYYWCAIVIFSACLLLFLIKGGRL